MGKHQAKHNNKGKVVMQIEVVPSPLMGVSRDLVLLLFLVQRGRHPYKWRLPL